MAFHLASMMTKLLDLWKRIRYTRLNHWSFHWKPRSDLKITAQQWELNNGRSCNTFPSKITVLHIDYDVWLRLHSINHFFCFLQRRGKHTYTYSIGEMWYSNRIIFCNSYFILYKTFFITILLFEVFYNGPSEFSLEIT